MNILVLHSELGVLRGGGENFSRNLFTAFAERGHSVAAAFVANRHGRYSLPLPSGIRPIPVPGWWRSSLGQATLSSVGRYLPPEGRYRQEWDRIQGAISWRVFRWHKQRFQRRIESRFLHRWKEYDVVYVHGDPALASMVARYRPTVLRLPGPVTAELEPMLRKVHAVCANGDTLGRIRKFLGEHATELPIGIDAGLFKPGPNSVRCALNWTKQHRVVGYVGRLTHLKGVDLLTAVFRKTLHMNPDTRLLIVGSGEEERNIRSDLSKELAGHLAHAERDVGHEKLAEWYRAMDLLVMPSRYENFSNTLIEGMACGIPFLASNVGGNRILGETGAGWLFESESLSACSSRLGEILENRPEMINRGGVGYRYVRKCYTWAASAQRLEEIITCRLDIKE